MLPVQLIIPACCWSVMINSIFGLASFGVLSVPSTAPPQNMPASAVVAVLMNLRLFMLLLTLTQDSHSYNRVTPLRFLVLLIGLSCAALARADVGRVLLQSTTSTQNSGLYDRILPQFEAAAGIRVDVVAVGTGQAIRNAMRGDGDILIVHDLAAERAFVALPLLELDPELVLPDGRRLVELTEAFERPPGTPLTDLTERLRALLG